MDIIDSCNSNNSNNGSRVITDEWIVLNVGGQIFNTTISTLTSCKDSVLYKMFSKSSILTASRKDSTGAYLIDRDPIYFRVILNYLRSPSTEVLIIDDGISIEGVLQEASFFQIDGLIHLIERIQQNVPDFTRKEILLYRNNIKFSNKKLVKLDLSCIDFVKDSFNDSDISYCKFYHCKLSHTQFLNVLAKSTDFSNCIADNINMNSSNIENSAFVKSDLSHALFNNCNLSMTIFDGSNLNGALFQRAYIINGSFVNTNLEHAKFQKACLYGCDFTGANIQNCHFTSADLRGAKFDWSSIKFGIEQRWFNKAKITKQQYDQIQFANKEAIGFKVREAEFPPPRKYIINVENK
eukprot:gene2791-3471_t